jgi:very-short-patch-repair endonuclease
MTEAEVEAHQRRVGRTILPAPAKTRVKTAPKESAIEALFAQQIEALGLPKPEREYKGAVIGRKYRLDFAWPNHGKVAVECQGHVHRIRERFLADCERTCLLVLAGWKVLPVSGDDVRSGDAVDWLATLLGAT